MTSEPEAQEAHRPLWRRAALVIGGPLLVSVAAVTILVTLFHTKFLFNDDTALASLANGDYTGKGSSSLVIAPAMFGHVLRLGYGLFPHLPWYGITLYTLQIVAWAAIGTAVFTLRRRPPIAERLVVAAVILAVAPWMILRLSFTPTSLLLGVAGVIVFAVAANVPGRVGVMYAVGGGVLLGTAFLVRSYSFVAVALAFAPVLVVTAVKAGVRRSAVFALVVGMFLVVGFGTNRLEYSRSAQWRAFMKMNSARELLQATSRLSNQNVSDSDLQQIGWTRNDLFLFAHFIYPDPHVYSDHNIRALAAASPPVRNHISPRRIFDVFRDSTDRAWDQSPAIGSLVAIGAVLALRRNRTAALVGLVSVLWFVGVLTMVFLYLRLPGRVLVPLEAGAVIIAAVVPAYLTPSPSPTGARRPWTSAALVALVALLVAVPAWHGIRSTSRISRQDQRQVRVTRRVLDKLEAFDPSGVFVVPGDRLGLIEEPLSTSLPFENPRLITLGWIANSPLFTARLARLGIDDLYTALRTNRHVYLVAVSEEARPIELFYRQHRGVTVHFRVVGKPLPGNSLPIHIWSASPGRVP